MTQKLLLSGSLLVLLLGLPARAQTPAEVQSFQQEAGDRSILFRGKQATFYRFDANGTPYWDNTGFKRGDIVFEGNTYYEVLIDIDAYFQRALVHLESGPFAVSLTPDRTPSIVMAGRRFAGFGPGEALPEGFYEILGDGREQVYKRIDKYVQSSLNNVNGSPIGYEDPNYRDDVFRYFAQECTYYFRDAEGRFTRIKSRGALLRQFPERRRELRKALKELHIRRDDFDRYCTELLKRTER